MPKKRILKPNTKLRPSWVLRLNFLHRPGTPLIDFSSLPDLLTIRQTANILQVHPNTLRSWDASKKLRAVRCGSRQDRRYLRDDVVAVWSLQKYSTQSVRRRTLTPVRVWRVATSSSLAIILLGALLTWSNSRALAESVPTATHLLAPAECTGWHNPANARRFNLPAEANPDDFTSRNSAVLSGQDLGLSSDASGAPLSFDQIEPVLECVNFALPEVINGQLETASLRVLLSSSPEQNSTELLRLSSSRDGLTWADVGVVPVWRDERGYVTFDLPAVAEREDLRQLQVRVTPELTPGGQSVVRVDGLAVAVVVSGPVLAEDVASNRSRNQELDGLTAFSQAAYAATDQPTILIPKQQVKPWFIFGQMTEEWKLKEAVLVDASGKVKKVDYRTVDEAKGDDTYARLRLRMSNQHPGKYQLRVTLISPQGTIETIEEPFLWGVVAMNISHAVAQVGDTQLIGMGVLDDAGITICDASITLRVTDPKGSTDRFTTKAGSVKTSGECVDKGVTNLADYYLKYNVERPGLYRLKMEAKTPAGTRVLEETFEVKPSLEFNVDRFDYSTRIYPLADYQVRLAVTPTVDFFGIVSETVPGDFTIGQTLPNAVVRRDPTNTEALRIEWAVNWKQGETYFLSYVFDAPDISPALFVTGPLRIGDAFINGARFVEPRQWQIASDALIKKTTEEIKFTPLDEVAGDWDTSQPALITTAKPIYNADEQVAVKLWTKGFSVDANPGQSVTVKQIDVTVSGGSSARFDEAHDLLTQNKLERTIVYLVPHKNLRPGTYTVTATLSDKTTLTKSFEWGTLQVVPATTNHARLQTINFQLADTNAIGQPNCDSSMSLEVTPAEGKPTTYSLADKTMDLPENCDPTAQIGNDRYSVKYLPEKPGVYSYKLSRTIDGQTRFVSGSVTVTDRPAAKGKVKQDIEQAVHTKKHDLKTDDQMKVDVNTASGSGAGKTTREITAVKLVDPYRKGHVIDPPITDSTQGTNVTSTLAIDTSTFKTPGKYQVVVDIVQDGAVQEVTQDFTWGVLAINVRRSISPTNGDTQIGLAALDDFGRTLCADVQLSLTVTDPAGQAKTLTLADGTITKNPECRDRNVTNDFDYFAPYKTGDVGTYKLHLVADTNNGQRAIDDTFQVKDNPDFDVDRTKFSMRIFPSVPYPQEFTIKANVDYAGPVTETVPERFGIPDTSDNGQVTTVGNRKQISWSVDWKKGETHTLGYTIDFPKISPEYYVLGPLTIGTFQEARQWQVASDATCTASVTGNWAAGATWGGTCGSNSWPGAAANGDVAIINANITVTNTTTLGFTIATITLNNPAATGANILNINTATTLTTTGDVVFNANTGTLNQTIQMHGTGILNVGGNLNMGNVPTSSGSALITTSVATTCSSCQVNVTGTTTLVNATTAVAGASKITMTTGATNLFSTAALTITANATGTGIATVSTATGTITTTGATTFTTVGAQAKTLLNVTGAGILNLGGALGANGTVTLVATSTTNMTATATINGAYTFGILNVNTGTTTTGAGTITSAGAMAVASGAIFTMGNFAFTASSTVSVTGTINTATGATGTRTFGALTVASGGTFDLSGQNPPVTFTGTITNNSANQLKVGSGALVLQAAQSLAGSGAGGMLFAQNPYTVPSGTVVTNNATVGTVTFTALTIANPTVANGLSLTTGSTTTVTGSLIYTANSSTAIAQTITMNGTANLNANLLTINAPTGTGNSVITCAASATGTFTVTTTTGMTGSAATAGAATITGQTCTMAFTGLVTLTGGATSAATINSTTGTLTFGAGLTLAGTAAQARLTTTGAGTINFVGTMSAGGTLAINAGTNMRTTGTTQLNGAYTFGILSVDSGTTTMGGVAITFAGLATVTGTLNENSATGLKTFTGGLTVASGGTFTMATTNPAVTFGGTITNNSANQLNAGSGSLVLLAAQSLAGNGAGGMLFNQNPYTIPSGTTITNNATVGTVTFTALTVANPTVANGLSLTTASITTVTNALTFTANSSATVKSSIVMNGTANLNAGSLVMPAPTGAGNTNVAEQVTCNAGSGIFTVTGTISLTGNSTSTGTAELDMQTCTLSAGATTINSGTNATGVAQIKSSTGTLTFTSTLTFAGANIANDKLTTTGAGIINLAGSMSGTGATLAINAGTDLRTTATPNIGVAATFGKLTVVSGTTTLGGVVISFAGAVSVSGTLNENSATGTKAFNSTFTVASGGAFDFSTTNPAVTFGGNITQSSNVAASLKAGTGTTTFSASLSLLGAGTGAINFSQATVTIPTAVIITNSYTGGTVTFGGSTGLTINNPAAANGLSLSTGSTTTITNALLFTANSSGTVKSSIDMNGTANLNAGSLTMQAPTGAGNTNVAEEIVCAAGGSGTLTVTGATAITGNSTSTGKATLSMLTCILNTGAATLTGGTNGTGMAEIRASTGTLDFNNGLTFAGTTANADLITTGAATLQDTGTISGGSDTSLSLTAGTLLQFIGTSAVNTAYTAWKNWEVVSGTTTLGATQTVTGLQVDNGAVLAGSTFLLTNTCTGTGTSGFRIDGTFSGSGGVTINTATCTIDAQGAGAKLVSNTGTFMISANATIASTADITIGAVGGTNPLTVTAGTTTNNGTVTIISNGVGAGLTGAGTWVNAANSTLNTAGATTTAISINILTATANPNTVNYNGDVAQTVKATIYYNLTLSPTITAGRIYSLAATTVNNNFTINPSAASAQTLTASMGAAIAVTGTTLIQGSGAGPATGLLDAVGANNLTTGLLSIQTNGTYLGQSSTITINTATASSTLFTLAASGATFTAGTSTVKMQSDADETLTSGTFTGGNKFNNLELSPAPTAARAYTFGAGAIAAGGTFLIAPISNAFLLTVNLGAGGTTITGLTTIQGTTATSNLATGNNAFTSGTLSIQSGGTFTPGSTGVILNTSTASSTLFTLGGSGVFTAGTSTIKMQSNADETLTSGTFTGGNAFNNLELSPPITLARAYTFGAGAITVDGAFDIKPTTTAVALTVNLGAGGLTVTGATTIQPTTATANLTTTGSNNPFTTGSVSIQSGGTFTGNATATVTVNGAVTIASGGTLTSTSGTLAVSTDFSNSGTFNHSSGLVSFTSNNATLFTGSTTFNNLTITDTVAKTVTFTASSTTTVSGAWTVTGASGQLVTLTRSAPTVWNVNPTSTSIDYVDVSYSTNQAAESICASHSQSTNGNNTNWTVTAGICTQISGVVYKADESTIGTSGNGGPCDGSTAVISIRVNGGTAQTATCSNSTAAYSIPGVPSASGDTVTVYLTSATKANTVTLSSGAAMSGVDVYLTTVNIRHENAGPMTVLAMTQYDNTANATDMLFDAVDATPDTLTVNSNAELHVAATKTFTPSGTVTTQGTGIMHVAGTATLDTATNTIAAGVTVPSGGTVNINADTTVGGTISVTSTGAVTTTSGTPTVTMSATSSITGTGNTTFYNILTSGTAVLTYNASGTNTINNNITAAAGTTVNLNSNISIANGLINATSGIIGTFAGTPTVTITGAAPSIGGGTTGAITIYNLATSGTGTTTFTNGGTNTITSNITVGTGTTLNLNSTISITGSLINTTTGIIGTSAGTPTVTVSGATVGSGSGAITIYRLDKAGAGTTTFSGSGTNTISNNLNITAGTFTQSNTMTVTGSGAVSAGATFNINADLNVNGGSLTTATTGIINTTAGTPTVTMSGTGSVGGGTTGAITVHNLTTTGSGTTTFTNGGTNTVNNNISVGAGTTLNINSSVTITGTATNTTTGVLNTSSGTPTVTINGTASICGGNSGNCIFYNLTFGGASTTLGSDLTVKNNLTLPNSVTAGSTTVTMGSGAVAGTLSAGTGDTLANLTVANTSGTVTLGGSNNLTVSSLLTTNAGGGSLTINSGRTLTLSANSGTSFTNNGTVTGAGTLVYQNSATTVTTAGTLSSAFTFDLVNGNETIPSRTFGGAVIGLNGTTSARQLIFGSAVTPTFSAGLDLQQSNATGTLLLDGATNNPTTVTVTGNVTASVATGAITISMGSGTWSVSGNFDLTNVGTFNHNSGTLTMNGTGTLTTNSKTLNNFTTSGGGTITLANATHTLAGNLNIGATGLTAGTSTIVMTGTSKTIDGGGLTLANLTISNTSGTITLQNTDLTVNTLLTISGSGGSLTLNASRTLTLSRNNASNSLTLTGTLNGPGTLVYQNATANAFPTTGTLAAVPIIRFDTVNGTLNVPVRTDYGTIEAYKNNTTTSTVILGTAGSQTITLSGNVDIQNGNATNGLTLDGATNNPAVNVTGNVTNSIATGGTTLSMGSGNWSVSGNFDLTNVGTFNHNSGTLTMNGTGTLTSNGKTFNNFTTSGGGTITLANATHTLAGNLNIGSTGLTAGTSTVVMTGASKTIDGGGKTLNNLTISNTSGTINLQNTDLTVSSLLTVSGSGGSLTLNASRTLTLSGASGTTLTLTGTITGAGRLTYQNTATAFPATGTISSILRMDATSGAQTIAGTNSATRTFGGLVEIYSNSAASARTVTMEDGTARTFAFSSHLYLIADTTQNVTLSADTTTDPTVTITSDLDFTGTGGGSEVVTSGSGTWTVSGNVDFTSGTYTATSGNTLTMNGSSKTLTDNANNLYNLTVSGGTVTLGDAVTITNDFNATGGTTSGTSNVIVNGNVTGTAGVLNFTGGTFEQRLTATPKTFGPSTASTAWTFSTLTFSDGNGATPIVVNTTSCSTCGVTITTALNIGKNTDTAGGTTTLNASDKTWTISGSGTTVMVLATGPAAVYNTQTSTFNFTGTSATTVPAGQTWNNLGIGSGSTVTYTAGATTINGTMTIAANATLSLSFGVSLSLAQPTSLLSLQSTSTISGTANLYYYATSTQFPTAGTINLASPGKVVFAAGSTAGHTIPARTFSGSAALWMQNYGSSNLTFTLGSGTMTTSGDLVIITQGTGNLIIDAAANNTAMAITGDIACTKTGSETRTINAGATGDWTVSGNANLTDCTYTATAGNLLKMNGTSKTLTTAGNALSKFEVSAGSTTMSGTTTVNSDLTISGGTLTAPSSGALNVAGDFTNNATFTHNSSTVTMSGTKNITGSAATTFSGLTITGTTVTVPTAGSDVTVNGTLNVNDAKTLSIASTRTVTAKGTLTLNTSGTISGAGRLTLTDTTTGLGTTGTLSSIVRFDATTANVPVAAIIARTYGSDLEMYSNVAAVRSWTPAAGTYTVSSNFKIITGASQSSVPTFAANTNNVTMNITGTLTYTKGGSATPAITSGTGVWTVSSDVDFSNGTYTATSGNTLTMNGSSSLIGNDQSLYKLTINGTNSTVTVTTSDVTVTNILTIGGDAAANTDVLSIGAGRQVISGTAGTVTITDATDTISGAGTLVVQNGSLGTTGTLSSAVRFDATNGDLTMTNRTYGGAVEVYNNHASTARVIIMAAGTHTLSSSLAITANNAANVTLAGTTNDPTLNLTGDLTMNKPSSGTPIMTAPDTGSVTWTMSGNVNLTNGTYTKGTETLTMNGAAKTLTSNTNTLNNLTFSGTGTTTLADSVTAAGNVVLNSTISAGSTTFTMNGAGKTLDGGGATLASLTISNTSGTITLQNTDLTVSSLLTVSGGGGSLTLNASRSLTLTGNSGTTLTLTGTLTGAGTLVYQNSATTVTTSGTLSSAFTFDLVNGSMSAPARTLGGAVVVKNGSGSTRTLTLGTAGSQTLVFSSSLDLQSTSAGSTLTLAGNTNNPTMTVTGSFTNSNATAATTVSMGSGTWTVSGSFDLTNVGTFNHNSGKLVMGGTGTLTSNSKVLNNLDVNSAGTVTLAGATHTLAGNLLLGGAGTPTVTSSTIDMTGSAKTIDGGNKTLNNLTLSDNTTLQGTDLTVSGTLTVAAAKTLTINVSRTLTHTGSTLTWGDSGSTIAGAGTVLFTDVSGGPGTGGVISAITRFDASGGNIASGTVDARTYSGKVELYSNSASNRTATFASGTYITSGSSSHFYVIANGAGEMAIDATTNNPTVTIGGDLDFTGTGVGPELISSGTGTWTVSGHVDLTDGVYAPTIVTLSPFWSDTGRQHININGNTCGETTTYSCTAASVNYGETHVIGDCIGASTDDDDIIDRGGIGFNPTGINDSATITSVSLFGNLSATYSTSINIGRSTQDNLSALTCITSSGVWSKLGTATYASSYNPGSAGGKVIGLGATAIADVTSRITGTTARLTVALNSTTTDADFSQFNSQKLYVGTTTSTSPTLIMNGAGKTLTTAGNGLYNLTLSGTGTTTLADSIIASGDVTLNNTVSTSSTTLSMIGIGKNLTGGSATINNLTIDPVTAGTITLTGSDLTASGTVNVASGDTLSIASGWTLTHSGATLTLTGTISGAGRYTYQSSTAFPTTGTISSILRFDATNNAQTMSNRTYGGAVEILNTSNTSARTVTASTGTLTMSSTLDLSRTGSQALTLELNTNDPTTTISGAVTIGAGTTFSANSANGLNINSNYTNNGTFTDNSGTVTLAGSAQQTLGGTMTSASDFSNLTVTNNSGSDPDASPSVIFGTAATVSGTFTASTASTKLRFNAGSTYTLVNITTNGQAIGTRVYLRSSSNGTQWHLTSTGTQTVTNTDVRDSNACGGDTVDAFDGTNVDATNNTCWNINTITLTISDTSIGFGVCTPAAARYATGDTNGAASDSVDAHTLSVATNARGGYGLTVAGATLTASVETITAIGGSATASSAGSEQFGLRAIKNSGTGTVASPFDTANWAFTAGSTQPVASYAGSSSSYSAAYGARYLCNVTGLTEAGSYSTDLTYILTSTF